MAKKVKGMQNTPKRQTVALVVEPGQTLAQALRAAWDKAHTAK